jgi:hypothetical protein
MTMRFTSLDTREVIGLAHVLANRVAERFPTRGLTKTAHDLGADAVAICQEAESLGQRNRALDILAAALFISGIAGFVYVVYRSAYIQIESKTEIGQALQGLDAGIHIIFLTALALLFLANGETRRKRRKAFEGLRGLRNCAHVVDMHQLNKDPAALAANLPPTRSSPERTLSPGELLRYLDYCSELLSLLNKFAALYAQYSRDPVVIEAVNDVELLTNSLSSKIWQKIMIVQSSLAASTAKRDAAYALQ